MTDENKENTSECIEAEKVKKFNLRRKSLQKIKTNKNMESPSEHKAEKQDKKLNLKRKLLQAIKINENISEPVKAKKLNLENLKIRVSKNLNNEKIHFTHRNSTSLKYINSSVHQTDNSSEIYNKLKLDKVPIVVLTRLEKKDKNPPKEIETDETWTKQTENKLTAARIDEQANFHISQLSTNIDDARSLQSSCDSSSIRKAQEENNVFQKHVTNVEKVQLSEKNSTLESTFKRSDDDSENEDNSSIFSNFEEFDPDRSFENDIVTSHSFEISTASSTNFDKMNILNFPAFNTTVYLPNVLQNSHTISKIDVNVDKKIDIRARYSSNKKINTSIRKIQRSSKLNPRLKLTQRGFRNRFTNNNLVRQSKKLSKALKTETISVNQKLAFDEKISEHLQKTEKNLGDFHTDWNEVKSQRQTSEDQRSNVLINQTDNGKSKFLVNSTLDETMPQYLQKTEKNSSEKYYYDETILEPTQKVEKNSNDFHTDWYENESQERSLEDQRSIVLNHQTDNEKFSTDETTLKPTQKVKNNLSDFYTDLDEIESKKTTLKDQRSSILTNNEKINESSLPLSSILVPDLKDVPVAEGEKDFCECQTVSLESQITLDLEINDEKFVLESCPTSPILIFENIEDIPIIVSEFQKLNSDDQNFVTPNQESIQNPEDIPIIVDEFQKLTSDDHNHVALNQESILHPEASKKDLSEGQSSTFEDQNSTILNHEPFTSAPAPSTHHLKGIPIITSIESVSDFFKSATENQQPIALKSTFEDVQNVPVISDIKIVGISKNPGGPKPTVKKNKNKPSKQPSVDVISDIEIIGTSKNPGVLKPTVTNKKNKPSKEPSAEVIVVQCSNCIQVSELISQMKIDPDEVVKCHYCSVTYKSISKLEYHIMTDHFKCKDVMGCNFSGFKHIKVVRKAFEVSESRTYVVLSLMCRCCCEIYTSVDKLNAHVKQKHRTLLRDSVPVSTASILGLRNSNEVECRRNCVCKFYEPKTATPTERNEVLKGCPNGVRFLETMVPAAHLVYSCVTCSTTFLAKSQAVEHAVKAHRIAHRHPCDKCLTNFKTKDALERHQGCVEKTLPGFERVLQVAILPTDITLKKIVTKRKYEKKTKHHLQRRCILCEERRFSSRSSLQNHIIFSHLLGDEVDEDDWKRMSEMVRMWKVRRLKMHEKTKELVEFLKNMDDKTSRSWIKNLVLKEKSENCDEQITDDPPRSDEENSSDSAIDSGDDASSDHQPPTSFERFECEKPVKSFIKSKNFNKRSYVCDNCDRAYNSVAWLDRHKKFFCKSNPISGKKEEESSRDKNSNFDDQHNLEGDPLLSNNAVNNTVRESDMDEESFLNEFLVFEKKMPDKLTEQESDDKSILESKIDKLIEEGNFENDMITGLDNDLLNLLSKSMNMEFLNLNDY